MFRRPKQQTLKADQTSKISRYVIAPDPERAFTLKFILLTHQLL